VTAPTTEAAELPSEAALYEAERIMRTPLTGQVPNCNSIYRRMQLQRALAAAYAIDFPATPPAPAEEGTDATR
jgi:hypothetical protein